MENYSTYNTIHNYTHISNPLSVENIYTSNTQNNRKVQSTLTYKWQECTGQEKPDPLAAVRVDTESHHPTHKGCQREQDCQQQHTTADLQPACKTQNTTNVSHQQYLFKTKSKTVYTNPFHSETINIFTFNQHTGLITVSKTTCTVCQIIWLR